MPMAGSLHDCSYMSLNSRECQGGQICAAMQLYAVEHSSYITFVELSGAFLPTPQLHGLLMRFRRGSKEELEHVS